MIGLASRPFVAVALVAFSCVGLAFSGCGDSGSSTDDPSDECAGGVIVDGKCEGKCEDSKCLENNVCVGNRCMLQCTDHDECFAPYKGDQTLQECAPQQRDSATGLNDGDTVLVCSNIAKPLRIGLGCPFGNECEAADDYSCPDGTRCTAGADSDACSAAECKPLLCLGTGEGDAEAYCTTVDCTDDAQCGPGMYCGIVRSSTQICGTMKGEDTPCLDPANFKDNASTFQEGPLSLLRNVCLKREPCAPCKSAVDCSLMDSAACVNLDGANVCAKTCGGDDDCPNDFACTGGFCTPGSGTCTPPKENNFCYSCLNDLQCGDATNSVACETLSGNQKACFDFSFPDECTTDGECPEAPSGRNGECLDEPEGLAPGDDVYHHCYFPFFTTSSSFQCWPD
jgi:hypothetical protein